jgi:hypothetical protein
MSGSPGGAVGAAMAAAVADRQSPPILLLWVFLFRSARLARADQPKTQYLHLSTFKIWRCHKQLAKNTEKCAINFFFKVKDDPAKIGPFLIRLASIKVAVGYRWQCHDCHSRELLPIRQGK